MNDNCSVIDLNNSSSFNIQQFFIAESDHFSVIDLNNSSSFNIQNSTFNIHSTFRCSRFTYDGWSSNRRFRCQK